MNRRASPSGAVVKVAVMGATGTGKSTFINLLTNDRNIRIGHSRESETSDIQTAHYIDQETGRSVMLIDTPGFDDSREGVTDTDILQKLARFLELESVEGLKLDGILYLHRITDPRVGGVSRKNLRMLQALCGEKTLRNFRIVTTFWNRVSEEEGRDRQSAFEQGAFKSLLDAGAQMRRHDDTIGSAQRIISELIPRPFVTTPEGAQPEDTAASAAFTKQIGELQKKHAQELADLKKEAEQAWQARDSALRAELKEERKVLEERIVITEEYRRRLRVDLKREMDEAWQARDSALRAEFKEERKVLEEKVVTAEEDRRKLQRTLDDAESAGKAVGFIGGLTSSLFGTAVSPAVAIFGP